MENNFFADVVSDFILVFISFAGTYIGLDSLPEKETLIQIINSPGASESTVDSIQKIMTIFSLLVSTIAGLIPIIKFINRRKNK